MPKIYRLSRTGLRLFYKVRHHRGHGIHSPFVFGLITKVIEEKRPYYLYQDIQNILDDSPEITKKVTKYSLLNFRIINYFNAKNIIELGSGYGLNTLFLTAPLSGSKCIVVEKSARRKIIAENLYKKWNRNIIVHENLVSDIKEKQDCIYINLNYYEASYEEFISQLLPLVSENSFIIIKGIRTKKHHQTLWRKLKILKEVTVSLDLYNMGILFFNTKYHKRNYRISF